MTVKNVFLTGATGTMGSEGLKQLLSRKERFNVVILVRPSEKNKKLMVQYENEPRLRIVWGDLLNYDDVLECVTGVDYVLHVAAFISPAADHQPEKAMEINCGTTKHIINAIKAQPDPDSIKLVYIGTVAQTGDRMFPIHWGRTGDPIKPSIYDNYAVSKIAAEREVIESGLKYWVSLRQTGIAYYNILNVKDGITFHQPLNNCLEWVTVHDSGILLANVCGDDVPEEFWCRIYNIGGGAKCRLTGFEYMNRIYKMRGIEDVREVVEPNWFATQNFHGQWYLDSDLLNEYLGFRTESIDDFMEQLAAIIAEQTEGKQAGPIPTSYIKENVMKPLAMTNNGTLNWLENNLENRITAFFGSRKKWEQISGWDKFENLDNLKDIEPVILDHGYDESKQKSELDINDMKQAAEFRGGECLSESMEKGDLKTKLKWRCAFGHEFEGSPTLVLLGGHWCPKCEAPAWNYDEIAKKNPFFAQVWYPIHDKDENNYYPADCYKDIL